MRENTDETNNIGNKTIKIFEPTMLKIEVTKLIKLKINQIFF